MQLLRGKFKLNGNQIKHSGMVEYENRQVSSDETVPDTENTDDSSYDPGITSPDDLLDAFYNHNQTVSDASDINDATDDEFELESTVDLEDVNGGISIEEVNKPKQEIIYDVSQQENRETQYPFNKNPRLRSPANNDPNTALYLDSSYLDLWLMNLGDSNEDWYCFTGEVDTKATVILTQPGNGDYDIYLYQLDVTTGTLEMVMFSEYIGGMAESFSYVIDTATDYYLQVVPYTPANPATTYDFGIFISDSYDKYGTR